MSYYRSSNTKPTITKPTNSVDCHILLKRLADGDVQDSINLQEIRKKIITLNDQLAKIQADINLLESDKTTIKSQISQNLINKNFLSDCLIKLEHNDKLTSYLNRCRDFINTYNWVNIDANDDTHDDTHDDTRDDTNSNQNTLKTLPYDIFDFLELKFAPLDSYTSDEIKKIAHYLKASELCQKINDLDDIPSYCRTYRELICGRYDSEFDSYIIGDIKHCDGTSIYDDDDDDVCCHKRHANVISQFKTISIDDTSIISYERIN